MKVKELIDLLQRIEDKEATVEVAIHQFNKRFPIDYAQIFSPYHLLQSNGAQHRIDVHLPDNMYTMVKKGKE